MSESKSTESLIKTWAETQQKLLTNWLDTVGRFCGAPGPELWTKTVEAWRASVKETLDAQEKRTHEWTETLAHAKGTPEELRELAQQGRDLFQRWTDAERQIWQGWFNVVKDINLRLEPATGAKAGTDMIQLWQDSAHKMIDTQASLVQHWTSVFTRTRTDK